MKVESILPHPNYKHVANGVEVFLNDVAIMRLAEEIPETPKVNVACLSFQASESFGNQDLTIVGWGKTESGDVSDTLKYGQVKGFPFEECVRLLTGVVNEFTEDMLCAAGKDFQPNACEGDSGGKTNFHFYTKLNDLTLPCGHQIQKLLLNLFFIFQVLYWLTSKTAFLLSALLHLQLNPVP
jgi:hypothetical protein